jgi:hypothetical protein
MTNTTKVQAIQGLRASNAAQPIPAGKVRREATRRDGRQAAIRRSLRGE